MYRGQLWINILVNKLAKAQARLPFPVYERDELNRPKADGHPMARLLARPNPAMSAHSLWIWTSSTRNTFGEAFWFKSRDRRGNVVALLLVAFRRKGILA
jgi:phage portal protein BeeE